MQKTLGDLVRGRKLVTVRPEDSVHAVARKIARANVGSAPVCVKGAMVGIFTERDLLKRIVAAGKDAKKVQVSKVMTKELVTATPGSNVIDALRSMREHRIRHLPVVDGKVLLGVLSQRDIVTALLEMKDEEIDSLKQLLDMLPVEPGVG